MAAGQAPSWTDYLPSTLAKAWSEATIIEGVDTTVETLNIKYVVQANYTGEQRDITDARHDLLRRWAKTNGHPADTADTFKHEVRLRAGSATHWLPIQNSLVGPFVKEVSAGSRVRLFIMYVGAVRDDRVFIVNEFEALPR